MIVTYVVQLLAWLIMGVAVIWKKPTVVSLALTGGSLLTMAIKSTGWPMWVEFITGCVGLACMLVEIKQARRKPTDDLTQEAVYQETGGVAPPVMIKLRATDEYVGRAAVTASGSLSAHPIPSPDVSISSVKFTLTDDYLRVLTFDATTAIVYLNHAADPDDYCLIPLI